jgi:hypothetical protein
MDDTVKKAEGELRRTDMDLKTGGHKKVFDKLPDIDKLVAEVLSGDPNHPRLANLIATLKTQKEKAEAKLGMTLTLQTDIEGYLAEQRRKADAGLAKEQREEETRAAAEAAERQRKEAEAAARQKRDAESREAEDALRLYYNSVEQTINRAKAGPGLKDQDIEDHLAATETLRTQLPAMSDALKQYDARKASDALGSYLQTQMQEAVENAAEWRRQATQCLAKAAASMLEYPRKSQGADVLFGQQIATVRKFLDFAARYDANDPDVKNLQAETVSLEKGASDKIASTKWEDHRNAPANAADLAAAGMKFFKGDKDWADRNTILAVSVKGQWTVQKKNILGAPILYGIAVNVAVQEEGDKGQNQARVFDGTLITVEMEGVKPEPPFDGFYVGGNWMVNADSVK